MDFLRDHGGCTVQVERQNVMGEQLVTTSLPVTGLVAPATPIVGVLGGALFLFDV